MTWRAGAAAALAVGVVGILPGVTVLAAAGGGGAVAAGASVLLCASPAAGTVLPTGAVITPAQSATAGQVLETAAASPTPTLNLELALADAGWTESRLNASARGGTHSLGVFQERATQGWGTAAQELNPATATKLWLARLPMNWQLLHPAALAQAVERSGYPHRYTTNLPAAKAIVAAACQGGQLTATDTGGGVVTPPANWTPPVGTDPAEATAASFALDQLGKPYHWATEGPNSFTCSGLTQAAWRAAGVAIGRTTYTQVTDGTPVASQASLVPGDLIFIMGSDPRATKPGHVGMYVGYGQLVDAPYTTHPVEEIPVSDWAGQIVAMRHIA